jgi:acyl-homoserine-lactone acylase
MLDAAASEVENRFGTMDVAYGDVYRLHYGDVDLPANGASGDDGDGAFRVVYFEPAENLMQSLGGDSYYAAIEFSSPLKARVLTAYGSSSQPGSPHRGDQLALFAKQQMRPALRTREEIEANLEQREELVFRSADRRN